MLKVVAAVIGGIAMGFGGALLYFHTAEPSTAQLDADLQSVKSETAMAESEASKYGGGLVLAEIELREATLRNTQAMLEQKRLSYLRGVRITYADNLPRTKFESEAIEALDAQISDAKAKEQTAEDEAKRTGGLLQGLVLARAEAEKLTEATLEQEKLLARYGIPLPLISASAPQPAPTPEKPIGPKVSDKDALQ